MMINGKTIQHLLKNATAFLAENTSIDTPKLDCEILMCHVLKSERIALVLNPQQELSNQEIQQFQQLLYKRKENVPIAYLTGEKEFMSLPFFVCPGVLIPRPDTEILVEEVIAYSKTHSVTQVLDLCCGSGAIGLSLAHYIPKCYVTLLDKYEICTETAQKNGLRHGLNKKTKYITTDLFSNLSLQTKFDCIVSNPPYIDSAEMKTLMPDVQKYEPHYALYGGEDGLSFYRRILEICKKSLLPNGLLALEIGWQQAESVCALICADQTYTSAKVIKDYSGNDRVIITKKVDKYEE